MPLYKATIEIDVVVVAENDNEASRIASMYLSDESANIPVYSHDVTEVKRLSDVTDDWLDSIPYGSKDNKTVKELLVQKG